MLTRRMKPRTREEWLRDQRAAYDAGYSAVAGIDEAGRGPLAGPVVAACVVLDPTELPEVLDDSKKLTAAARERACQLLLSSRAAIGIGFASPTEIDTLNIRRATHLAMERALLACPAPVDFALVDGLPVPTLRVPHRAIVRGDAQCAAIAAASVVAKVTRDEIMASLDGRFPEYGFAAHKGYPTPAHLAALRQFGPSPVHRRSYQPVQLAASPVPLFPVPEQPAADGAEGEAIARLYLERQGHTILATHYRSHGGEVDIISLANSTLVFTEVKTSRHASSESPAARLSAAQRQRIAGAAAQFLATTAIDCSDCRFDVIEVILGRSAPSVRHHVAAFEATPQGTW